MDTRGQSLDSMPTMQSEGAEPRPYGQEQSLDSMPTMRPEGAQPRAVAACGVLALCVAALAVNGCRTRLATEAEAARQSKADWKGEKEFAVALKESKGEGSKAGATKTVTVKGVPFELVYVAPGTFAMGSDDSDAYFFEKPVHEVTLTKGYWIGKTEVTQRQWEAVMGGNPSKWKGKDLPVETVSWNDCQEFIEKLNGLQGDVKFALPTEAQWEFAARGGTKSKGYKYSGSNSIGEVAWYDGNSDRETHPVGTKKSNELGIHDMSGNVWEWCQVWYGNYPSGAVTDPVGAGSGDFRVFRGGSWYFTARFCRSALRDWYSPGRRYFNIGFRLAASAGQ